MHLYCFSFPSFSLIKNKLMEPHKYFCLLNLIKSELHVYVELRLHM